MDAEPSSGESAPRKRVSTACEACRATKIKCQPSEQPGVCRKCLDSKRECISRTGPRTRRPRRPRPIDGAMHPPPAGPSKTFTIEFDVPSQPDVDETFDALRDTHAHLIDAIFPPESSPLPMDAASADLPTPPSSSAGSLPMQALHAKPQFNLSSATSLLAAFRGMQAHFPCTVLQPPPGGSVAGLAAARPFVLLAILAAAAASRTLQGHSLYDDEFRKVLGLKFVAAGDRSLELLQGILIYCAWYPFHLRPRNKQAYHYIRMAGDLVHDLELDQEGQYQDTAVISSEQLERIRAYLAYSYSVSLFDIAWMVQRPLAASFTPWTSTCCDILERHAEVEGDLVLSSLVRLASATGAAQEALRRDTNQSNQQTSLVLLGLEAQHRERCGKMLPDVARSAPVRFSEMFFALYLKAGSLLQTRPKQAPPQNLDPSVSTRLRDSIPLVKNLLAYLLGLDGAAFSSFVSVEWCRFIFVIIVAVRLSFPLPEHPDWDAAWARSELRLGDFLAHVCDDDSNNSKSNSNNGLERNLRPESSRVDVLSASRVVLRVVRQKYERRLAHDGTAPGCPMLDGSLDQYLPLWDASLDPGAGLACPAGGAAGRQPVFHDLWATMTMGWAKEDQTSG